MKSFVVKKLGGENAAEMLKSAQNVIDDAKKGVRQSVIVSAMRSSEFNTTDELIKIGKEFETSSEKRDFSHINDIVQAIGDFHRNLIKEKVGDIIETYGEAERILEQELNYFGKIIRYAYENTQNPKKENDYTITGEKGEKVSIIGFGEVLSAKIFSTIINELSKIGSPEVQSSVLDTSKAIGEIIGENAFMTLARNLSEKVNSQESISIIPGYVGGFDGGIESAVGRGYSDATAAALAVGLKTLGGINDVTLEIQKSVRGLLSADPRILENQKKAVLIPSVDYIMGIEIIRGAKAKLLHDQALRKEIIENGIKIKLFDPFDTSSEGTIIGEDLGNNRKGIEFIGAKESAIFSISSINMGGPGILERIFKVVTPHASIDAHGGSETEVAFSIETGSAKNLKSLQEKLKKEFGIERNSKYNFVKLYRDCATIHCVGNIKGKAGILSEAAGVFKDSGINIRLPCQGMQERAMIFGIDLKDMKKAVNALHTHFIKQ